MEYLVIMTTRVPDGTSEEAIDDIRTREDAHSRELASQGEFLTTFTVTIPESTAAQTVEDTKAREAERAHELAGQGHLLRLWALPGEGAVTAGWPGASTPGRPSGRLPRGCPAAGCRTGRGR